MLRNVNVNGRNLDRRCDLSWSWAGGGADVWMRVPLENLSSYHFSCFMANSLSFVTPYAESSGFSFVVVHAMESYLWGGDDTFDTDWASAEERRLMRGEKISQIVNSSRMPSSRPRLRLYPPGLFVLLLCREFHVLVSKRPLLANVWRIFSTEKKKGPAVLQYCYPVRLKSYHWLVNHV